MARTKPEDPAAPDGRTYEVVRAQHPPRGNPVPEPTPRSVVPLDGCKYCGVVESGHTAGGHRWVVRTRAEWRDIALAQADTMAAQATRIRELVRENDDEKSNAEAAHDMAHQYARRCGVDTTRDDVLAYVDQYWRARGALERQLDRLDGVRTAVAGVVTILEDIMLRQHREVPTADVVKALVKVLDGARASTAARYLRPAVEG